MRASACTFALYLDIGIGAERSSARGMLVTQNRTCLRAKRSRVPRACIQKRKRKNVNDHGVFLTLFDEVDGSRSPTYALEMACFCSGPFDCV